MSHGKRSRSRKSRTKKCTLFSAVSIEFMGLVIFLSLLSAIRENHSSAEMFSNIQSWSHQASILPPKMALGEYPEYSAGRLGYRNY